MKRNLLSDFSKAENVTAKDISDLVSLLDLFNIKNFLSSKNLFVEKFLACQFFQKFLDKNRQK